MAYRVYLTVELLGDYPTVEHARGAAVQALQEAVDAGGGALIKGRALQARVFPAHAMLSEQLPAFIVDIFDGCI